MLSSAEIEQRESHARAEATVLKLRHRIEACFAPHLGSLQSRRVVLTFTLQGSGKASAVSVDPNLGVVSLRNCVRDALRTTRFDRPGKDGMRVSVQLDLAGP